MPENTSDIDQHIERYRKLLERDPNSRVFAPLAEACRKANRLEEALTIARTGVAIHPAYASGRVALARAQLALDRHDEAAGELVEAISHAPENALAHRLLGEARVQLGDLEGAFEAFARALALNPDDEEARQALAGIEPAPTPVVVETPAATAVPGQAAEEPGTFAEAKAADETPEPALETDALPTPWWEDASIQAAPDGAEASGDIEARDPVPTSAEPEAAEPDTADSIVYQEAVPDSIPLLDLPSDSDLPEDELTLDLEPVGPGASAPADTFAEALVETAPNLTEADSIWEEQSGPEVDAEPPDFGPAEVMSDNMSDNMLDNMEEDPSGVVLLEDELPEIEANDEVTVKEGAAGEFAHDAVWPLDDADLTGGVRAGDVEFEMD
ncbi:MAG: tetratricopeptide repeat protein, partial [Deltaproteobacteria bacterium]|nr:tetratricopeptide repeat protein [Deltaproteobacteria bacterium]